MLVIMLSTRKFRHYLLGKKLILVSDQNDLSYLKTMKHTNGRRTRWLMELEEYDFEFEFINGKRNVIADGLSRCVSATLLESSVDLAIEQDKDQNIKKVKELLTIGQNAISTENQPSSDLWEQRNRLEIVENVLVHHSRRGLLSVIPHYLRYDLFKLFIDKSISHLGVNKTHSAILEVTYSSLIKQNIIE
ncbi:Retrovirus-related Pol polyprotein from transposon 17.6 [Thelohanellus kitauei]|uniref:Retrovirus-related Pol polyprotein from transposon 17.6 n=1 Tax=Thelohanellus kitauei TaxID=669202 RepID=A0A0C2M824_THEKT|nr:Retrovirus-related Pol polyprotein from transposon 17.6 [Thelohanellus kitauei]